MSRHSQIVSLLMIDLGGDVTGNGISKLVFTILSAVAEAERDRIRERIRDVKASAAASSCWQRRRPNSLPWVGGTLAGANNSQMSPLRVRSFG